MRAIVQSRYGPPGEVLQAAEMERPGFRDDEVVVRVRASAVHADIWHAVTGTPKYLRTMLGWRAPKHRVPGTDLAGVVESIGPRVTRFKPGDEVFGAATRGFPFGNAGTFAEYAAAPEQSLALKPANVTFEQAASVPASGYIAFSNLISVETELAGKRGLVNGAGGGVGTIAVQMLKARGAHLTAVDAGPKLDTLRPLGADETIDYTKTDFVEQGIRYDLIFDVASNRTLSECRRVLTPGGLFIWIGHEHYGRAKGGAFLGHGLPRAIGLMGRSLLRDPHLRKMEFPPKMPKLWDALEAMRNLMAEGKLTPLVEAFPLSAVAEAFRRLEEGTVLGKAVLTP